MSSADLLDVNFLIALAWPNHIAHTRAVSWFRETRTAPFATCPITEAGFVRISMNPLIVSERTTAAAAVEMLSKYQSRFPHVFWPDDVSIADALSGFPCVSGHRQITDAYLLALAASHSGRLITFDGGIAAFAPERYRPNVVVVEG
ncbi:MAG: TA system VapC family ribonuclease toxin [Treponemataceae bacterium]